MDQAPLAPKFTREDFSQEELEAQIRKAAQERKLLEQSKGISLTSVSCDTLLYDNKSEQQGYDNFIDVGDQDEEDDHIYQNDYSVAGDWKKQITKFNAPTKFLNETAKMIERQQKGDVFDPYRTKTIAERESDYLKRWRKRAQLSPERLDPFAPKKPSKQEKQTKRSYSEIIQEAQIEKEKADLLFELKKKSREEQYRREMEKKYKKQKKSDEPSPKKQRVESSRSEDSTDERRRDSRSDDRRDSRGDDRRRRREYDDDDYRRRDRSDDRRRRDYDDDRRDDRRDKRPQWGKPEEEEKEETEPIIKEEPNYKPSGKLYEEETTFKGVKLKWTEPPEARKPTKKWRLYVYKNGKELGEPYKIHRQPAYMFGRDRNIVDIPLDHPSCSKQHAVICFRLVEQQGKNFTKKRVVKPYLIDLKSTNGTFIGGNKIEDSRYYELKELDVIKFGNSSREFVILHEETGLK